MAFNPGAPQGNQNAAKAKIWTAAIERALERRSRAEQVQLLDKLADTLLDLCLAGSLKALQEFGNRMEGKPDQNVHVTTRKANELSDDDLNRIAAGSGEGTAESPDGAQVPSSLH